MEALRARLIRTMALLSLPIAVLSGGSNLAQGWGADDLLMASAATWLAMALLTVVVLLLLRRNQLTGAGRLFVSTVAIGVFVNAMFDTTQGAIVQLILGPIFAALATLVVIPEQRRWAWHWVLAAEAGLGLLARHQMRPFPGSGWSDIIPGAIAASVAIAAIVAFMSWVLDELTESNASMAVALEENRRARRALEVAHDRALAASNAKATFLANMSHELRTPLNAVLGYAELLAESESIADSDRKDVQHIETAAHHLLSLISDVLDLSRIEAGHHKLELERAELTALCDDVHTITRNKVEHRANSFELNVEEGSILIPAAPVRQILINLLDNASRFTENGTITLSCRREPRAERDGVLFQVIDTGAGIPAERQESIFHPFSTTDGIGIGLALSRALAEAMGGTLTVASRLDEGSRFELWIPDRSGSIEPQG